MASTGEVWKLGRRPALDGLRGIAVLLVVVTHVQVPGLAAAGAVGVGVFFTLSGFLITSLLLEEHERDGRVSLSAFYVRRARRLLPALGVTLALWLTLDLALHGAFTETPLVLGALTYAANFVMASGAYSAGGAALGHMWSLAIEEQFYLLWPAALLALRRFPRPLVTGLLLSASLGSLVLREGAWLTGRGGDLGYYGTLHRMDGLLIGCALALILHGRRVPAAPAWLLPAAGVTLGSLTLATGSLLYVWLPTLVSASTAGALYAVCTNDCRRLAAPWLRWFGTRSYGIYLLHHVLLFLAHQLWPERPWWLIGLVVVPVSLLAAEASWRLIERPVLAGKWRQASPDAMVPIERPITARVGVRY